MPEQTYVVKATANTIAAELYESRKLLNEIVAEQRYRRQQRMTGGYVMLVAGVACCAVGLAIPVLLPAGAILGTMGVVRMVGE